MVDLDCSPAPHRGMTAENPPAAPPAVSIVIELGLCVTLIRSFVLPVKLGINPASAHSDDVLLACECRNSLTCCLDHPWSLICPTCSGHKVMIISAWLGPA